MASRAKRGISPFYNRITLLVLIVLVVLLGFTVFEIWGKERESAVRQADAVRELHEVEGRAAALGADLAILDTPRGKEALVRNTFDVAKEGEEVIVVLDALPATTTEEKSSGGIFSWFLSLFE